MSKTKQTKTTPNTKKSDYRMSPPGGYNGNRRRYGEGGKSK